MDKVRPEIEQRHGDETAVRSSRRRSLGERQRNDNDRRARGGETLRAWGWRETAGLTLDRLLAAPNLDRTETAILVVQAAQARGPVPNPTGLFFRAWTGRWLPSPTPAEIQAARATREALQAESAAVEARRQDLADQAETEGVIAAILARLPASRVQELEAKARDGADGAIYARYRRFGQEGRQLETIFAKAKPERERCARQIFERLVLDNRAEALAKSSTADTAAAGDAQGSAGRQSGTPRPAAVPLPIFHRKDAYAAQGEGPELLGKFVDLPGPPSSSPSTRSG